MKIRVFQENPAKIYSEKHPAEHEKDPILVNVLENSPIQRKKMLGNIFV